VFVTLVVLAFSHSVLLQDVCDKWRGIRYWLNEGPPGAPSSRKSAVRIKRRNYRTKVNPYDVSRPPKAGSGRSVC
jgi:hypothetical protein